MNVLILTIGLGFILILCLVLMHLNYVHPAVLFISMFFINSLFYLFWVPMLPDINFNTVEIVLSYCLLFLFTSIIHITSLKKREFTFRTKAAYIAFPGKISLFLFVFNTIAFILYYYSIRDIIGVHVGLEGFAPSEIMAAYSGLSKFTNEDVGIPIYIKLVKELVFTSGFVLSFVIFNNYFAIGKKAVRMDIVGNIFISGIITVLNGSRSEFVRLLIGMVVIYFSMLSVYSVKKRNIKSLSKIVLLFLVLVLSFKEIGNLMGRNNERSLAFTLLMYIGGPLKNLDIALNTGALFSELPGQITFAYQYHNLAILFGNNSLLYDTSLPFTKIRGVDLGNVYTAFAPYIVDFGSYFAIILVIMMGITCGWLYRQSMSSIYRNEKHIWTLIYSFSAYSILMSGFSEKFYGHMLSGNYYRHILFLYIFWRMFVNNKKGALEYEQNK